MPQEPTMYSLTGPLSSDESLPCLYSTESIPCCPLQNQWSSSSLIHPPISLSALTPTKFIHHTKLHPSAAHYDQADSSELNTLMVVPTTITRTQTSKKLRRLPHVFGNVLELPFKSEADVSVEEHPGFFQFVAEANMSYGDQLRAYTVELYPGIKKIVIRGDAATNNSSNNKKSAGLLLIDDLELDAWRFRLPAAACTEAVMAVFGGGKLVVTVPKRQWRGTAATR